jgi:competence protein ComEA
MKRLLRNLILGLFLFLTAPALFAEVVNINKADAATLQQHLTGIGPVKSKAIIDYRNKHGSFKGLDDLLKVEGFGPALLEKNKRNLSISRGVSKPSTTQKSTSEKERPRGSTVEKGARRTTTKEKQTSTTPSNETTKNNKAPVTKKDDPKANKTSTTKKPTASNRTPKRSSTQRQTRSDSKETK